MTVPQGLGQRSTSRLSHAQLCLEDKYEILQNEIGDGSFGSVALARVRTAGASVARRGTLVAIKTMKKTFDSFAPCLELREVIFLRTLPFHAHLVPALDIFLDPMSKKLHICMEHMDGNLYQLMKAREHKCMQASTVKSILYQILSGLEHIHAHGFFHRDIKPENILVSSNSPHHPFHRPSAVTTPPPGPIVYTVKIADFGLARETHSRLPYTTYVSTRWYRAPEVLLRAGEYSAPVDIWAIGAMAVEIATLKPLFPGSNEVDQVWRVCEMMGSPGNWYSRAGGRIGGGDWSDGARLAHKLGFSFPKMAPHSMESILQPPHWPASLCDFVTWCLMWDPRNRPTSTQALHHEYFFDAIDPLRAKSASSSRGLTRKKSDLALKAEHASDGARPLNAKPSWFRRSLIGRDGLAGESQVSIHAPTEPSRPPLVQSSTLGNVSNKTKTRVQLEKRSTWTNGLLNPREAPMPILPSIRPISPLSDAVTAQASARTSDELPCVDGADDGRRRTNVGDRAGRKLGRQLSVASHGNHYADLHRQEAERVLNGNATVTSPSHQKESFFSHLRKRARRLSGRNGLPLSPDVGDFEASVGCGPWSSNRSSMTCDQTPAAMLVSDSSQFRELDKILHNVRHSLEMSSPASQGGLRLRDVGNSKSSQSPAHDQGLRLTENVNGPVSSRTRRALQRSSQPVHRYETPDEEDELLDEVVSSARQAARHLDRTVRPEDRSARRDGAGKQQRRALAHLEQEQVSFRGSAPNLTTYNPYPTPSPSGKRNVYVDQLESMAKVSPIDINNSYDRGVHVHPKWPTPPHEENEWAAQATQSIFAAGTCYR